jgi:hypothetical protein
MGYWIAKILSNLSFESRNLERILSSDLPKRRKEKDKIVRKFYPQARFSDFHVGLYMGILWKICQNRPMHPKSAKGDTHEIK